MGSYNCVLYDAEDALSMAIARRLLKEYFAGYSHRKASEDQGGKESVRKKMNKYIERAQLKPFLILVDQDREKCPLVVAQHFLKAAKQPCFPPKMIFAVATREIEAWLLGDEVGLSAFLGVSRAKWPQSPETLPKPKRALVKIAQKSRKYRAEICPEEPKRVGPGYNDTLAEFARKHWNFHKAAANCPSLRHLIDKLNHLKPAT